jgi:hypothetical protein
VLTEDREGLERINGKQGVVGHHDVRRCGALARPLGKALLAIGATMRTDAVLRAHGHLSPAAIADTGRHVVPVACPRTGRPFV